jgi:hypothetical protein
MNNHPKAKLTYLKNEIDVNYDEMSSFEETSLSLIEIQEQSIKLMKELAGIKQSTEL